MKKKAIKKLLKRNREEFPKHIQSASAKVQAEWSIWNEMGKLNKNHPDKIYQFDGGDKVVSVDCGGVWGKIRDKILKNGGKQEDVDECRRRFDLLKKMHAEKMKQYRIWSKLLKTEKGMKPTADILEIEKERIIDLFGQYYTQGEVYKIMTQEWMVSTSLVRLAEFQRKYQLLIDKKKTEFVRKNKDFRLATDTGRLEDLSGLLFHWKNAFKGRQSIEVSREIRAIIEQARKEVKGEEIKLTVDGKIDIEATQNANMTMDQVFSHLPINLMIIGMVSARANISPLEIMASLSNSYYSKFNGFSKLELEEDIPSMQRYVERYNLESMKSIADSQPKPITMGQFEDSGTSPTIQEQAKLSRQAVLDKIADLKSNRKTVEDVDWEEASDDE